MSDVKVTVTPQGDTLRVGDAPRPLNPTPYSFTGTIEAPTEYASGYSHGFAYKVAEASYGVWLDKITPATITLRLGYDTDAAHVVKGVLDLHPLAKAFRIGEKMPQKQFLTHLRVFRGHFADVAEYSSVVEKITDLQVRATHDLSAKEDRRGNKSSASNKQVFVDVAESFTVGFPLFNDETENTVFSVDLCLEHSDMGVMFWMESYELQKLLHEHAEQKVDYEIEQLKKHGITVLES